MIKSIKMFIERGRKGYCLEDLWSFDNFLSDFLARALREFKQQSHCYPHDLNNWEEWMAIVDEMIECFEDQNRGIDNLLGALGQPVNSDGYFKAQIKKREKLHRGMELLEKYYYDLWD